MTKKTTRNWYIQL